MKIQHVITASVLFIGLSACTADMDVDDARKEQRSADTQGQNTSEKEPSATSKSNASLELTIDGENYDARCNEHYLNIAQEQSGEYSYSLRMNMNQNESRLTAFQLTFREEGKLELPYEVELDFKKSAVDNKLKTHLTVFYLDENDKIVQTSQDVGKIVITKLTEEEITLEVDTKLLLLNTVNIQGEGETVHLKGTVHSKHPIVSMLNGAKKESVL
jgi:hypothetical protein